MPGLTFSRPAPAFAISALAAALLVAFPVAHATPSPKKEIASGRDDVKLRYGTSYEYLEAKRGGEISGRHTTVKGKTGTLVNANSGGRIELKDADIEAGRTRHGGHHNSQGPAVSATGNSGYHHGNDRHHHDHGRHNRDSVVVLKGGSVTTHGSHSPAIRASQDGGKIFVDGTELRTNGSTSDVVQALDGGSVVLRKAEIKSRGHDSDGVKVSGHGSTASIDKSHISTSGYGADGVDVEHGGIAVVSKTSIRTSGRSANGVEVSGDRSRFVGNFLNVSTKGDNTAGLNVEDGGSLSLRYSDVKSAGKSGKGVAIDDGGQALIVGSKVEANGERGIALNVEGEHSKAIVLNSRLQSSGRDGRAVLVEDAASAIIAGSTIQAKGLGVEVQGRGSRLIAAGTSISAESGNHYRHPGKPATGLRVEDQGTTLLIGGNIQATGDHATGVSGSDRGSTVLAVGTSIHASGDDSAGMRISKDARAILVHSEVAGDSAGVVVDKGAQLLDLGGTITANGLDGVAVNVRDGGRAYLIGSDLSAQNAGLQVDGKHSSVVSIGSTVVAGQDTLPAARGRNFDPAVGVASKNGAKAVLIGGEITAHGDDSVAAMADGASMLIGAAHVATTGSNATAVLARQSDGRHGHGRDRHAAGSKIAVIGSTLSTSGDESAAVKASGKRSAVLVAGSTLTTTGQGSHGAEAENGGKIVLSNSTVNVSGNETAAIYAESERSRHAREVSEIFVNHSQVSATGENSAGIELANSASLYLSNSTVNATGASLVSNLTRGGQTQQITVGDGATLVENNGTLLQVNRSGESGSSKVKLDLQDGSITAGNIIDDLAVDLTGNGGTYVKLGALAIYDGKMIGVREVTTEGGNQSINFEGGSTVGDVSIDNKAVTSGGTVEQRIAAAGDVTVDDAAFGGNWTIAGKLTSRNGGIIKPGNSVGVVTTSSIDWQPGTVYQAEINQAGQSDLIEVTGVDAANIANTSLVVSEENGQGRFRLNHDYTILTAAGGVEGKFANSNWAGSAYPLISMSTLYSGESVAVRMGVNRHALNTMDFTENQRAAGFGAASVAGANATADEAFFSSNPAQAFDQLSGEVHATVRSLAFSDMLSTNAALQSQMRANLGAGLHAGQPTAASGGTPSGAQPKSDAYPLWVRFNAADINNDGDSNTASAHYSATRLLVGGDTGIGNGWRLGAAGGVTSGDFTVKDRSSEGSLDSYTFAVYGGKNWSLGIGKLNLLLGGGYTRHNVDTDRDVSLGAGQKLSADYHGSTWQLFGDLGYAIPWGETHNIEPYVNISWFNQRMSGFDESGGDAALSSSASTAKLASYTLGLRSALVFPGKTNAFTVRTNLGWRHAGGDRSPTRSMRFIEGAGSAFSVSGAPIAKNSLLLGLSGEVSLDTHFAMGLSYDGEFGSGNTDNAGSLYMKVRF